MGGLFLVDGLDFDGLTNLFLRGPWFVELIGARASRRGREELIRELEDASTGEGEFAILVAQLFRHGLVETRHDYRELYDAISDEACAGRPYLLA